MLTLGCNDYEGLDNLQALAETNKSKVKPYNHAKKSTTLTTSHIEKHSKKQYESGNHYFNILVYAGVSSDFALEPETR